jgi:formiminotetrahydrofolate cyclodeaminase
MARAGVHGAALNVLINLGSIHDAEYAGKTCGKVAALRGRADELCAEAVRAVEEGFR